MRALFDWIDTLTFLYEWVLWLIPPIILGVVLVNVFAFWRTGRRLRRFLSFGFERLEGLPALTRFRLLRAGLLALGLSLLALAAARPATPLFERDEDGERYGLDFFIALDASKSMLAVDVEGAFVRSANPGVPRPLGADPPPPSARLRQATRFDSAQQGIQQLLEVSRGDRIGLIAFSQKGYLRAPLTYDYTALDLVLRSIRPENTLPGGSSMVAGMDRALQVFENLEVPRKVLVVISDGEELEGDAVAKARELSRSGIRVFTVGVGSDQGGQIPIYDARQNPLGFLTDPDGDTVRTRLDAVTLRQMAQAGGGEYVAMGTDGEGLLRLYQERLLPLGERVRDISPRNYTEHFQWPLAVGFCILLLEFLLRERRLPLGGGAVLNPQST
ncbi:MAG: VWA domain-containing protein [Opitutales bacterium]